MALYAIHNKLSGLCLGEYEAISHDDALENMARDAGYRSYAEACRVALVDESEIVVELLT